MKIKISLKDQVVRRDIAEELTKKLKSMGIEVESALRWYKMPDDMYNVFLPREERILHIDAVQICIAPTLPEILSVLPDEIDGHQLDLNTLEYIKYVTVALNCDIPQSLGYDKDGCMPYFKERDEKLSATAVAKLAIWAIDEGHIKGEEANDDNRTFKKG
jgi:hypothetical protein